MHDVCPARTRLITCWAPRVCPGIQAPQTLAYTVSLRRPHLLPLHRQAQPTTHVMRAHLPLFPQIPPFVILWGRAHSDLAVTPACILMPAFRPLCVGLVHMLLTRAHQTTSLATFGCRARLRVGSHCGAAYNFEHLPRWQAMYFQIHIWSALSVGRDGHDKSGTTVLVLHPRARQPEDHSTVLLGKWSPPFLFPGCAQLIDTLLHGG